MSNPSRRGFVMSVIAGGTALASARAMAQAPGPKLLESDPQAVALGYKDDTTKVDKAKYPQHQPAQMCSNCNFYMGKATDPMAPCPLFANKQVANKGWCSAWSKKAGT